MSRFRDPQTVPCGKCQAQVYRKAIKCPHCGSSLVLDNDVRTRFVSHSVSFGKRKGVPWPIIAAAAVAAAVVLIYLLT